jgi:hypothetical protein
MLAKIDEVRQTESPIITTARNEIQRLRTSAESQVAQSQTLIERLRGQLGDVDNANELEADIDTQQDRIKLANIEIDTLTEEKIGLEAEYRKLEAEVGPIKYIAEFVYGESADSNMLEEAVRWVIIIIIFVFDPLAVLLLIAAQYTFDFRRKELEDDNGERLRLEREEFERARAQRIVDNPRFTLNDPVPPGVEEPTDSVPVEEEKEQVEDETTNRLDVEQPNRTAEGTEEGGTGGDTSKAALLESAKAGNDNEAVEEDVGEQSAGADASGRDDTARVEPVLGDLGDIPDTKNRMFYPEELEEPKKKVVLELPEESNPNSRYYADREQDDAWVTDRAIWESNNPKEDRDAWKNAFEKGEIDSLPWEQPAEPDNYNASEGYQQNAEQSENTLFNKLSKK